MSVFSVYPLSVWRFMVTYGLDFSAMLVGTLGITPAVAGTAFGIAAILVARRGGQKTALAKTSVVLGLLAVGMWGVSIGYLLLVQ